MTISRRAIASTLAGAFSPWNLSTPSGETAVQTTTYMLPDRINQTPCVLVFPPEEDMAYPAGSMRHSDMDWRVRFYLYKLQDTGRQTDLLYKWLDVLAPALDTNVRLGLSSSVHFADVVGMKAGTLTYADEALDGIEVAVRVRAEEAVSFSG
mgnify:FL=1